MGLTPPISCLPYIHMNDNDFRRRLEMDAANQATTGDLSRIFDGLAVERIPFARAHLAFAALDAYLMMAADIYGRKGVIFNLSRQSSYLTIARGSQIVTCTHYLNLAAIGFRYQGNRLDPSMTPFLDDGPPSVGQKWTPKGDGLLLKADQHEIQDIVSKIVAFLQA